jgi:hypothetical protein
LIKGSNRCRNFIRTHPGILAGLKKEKRMKFLKTLSLAAMAIALLAFGAGTTSATELYKNTSPNPNDTLGAGTEIEMSVKTGTTMLWKFTYEGEFLGTLNTCTNGSIKSTIETVGGGEGKHPGGKITGMSFSSCTHTISILKSGQLEIQHIPGTTNGIVISKEAEITLLSTLFGASCVAKTGAGTKIGTLTGATSSTGQAIFDVDAGLTAGFCTTTDMTGTYVVTKPVGLIVEAS